MQFVYSLDAGNNSLTLNEERYRYIIKARRHKLGDLIFLRNLKDDLLYSYELSNISRKEALLVLKTSEKKVIQANKKLHIIWCIVDIKTIEKQLPYLNEIGVSKISFVYGDYSQKSFKLNFDKFEKILINSSSQCGRSSIIKLDLLDSLDEYLEKNNDVFVLNFSENRISEDMNYEKILIGCEGGFSKREINQFESKQIIGLNSTMILKSETAITAIASKILL